MQYLLHRCYDIYTTWTKVWGHLTNTPTCTHSKDHSHHYSFIPLLALITAATPLERLFTRFLNMAVGTLATRALGRLGTNVPMPGM